MTTRGGYLIQCGNCVCNGCEVDFCAYNNCMSCVKMKGMYRRDECALHGNENGNENNGVDSKSRTD